jgi:trehalose synthase-fused probable maltokinase
VTASESELLEFVTAQRWYGARTREAVGATVLDQARFAGDPEVLQLILEISFASGNHEVFQLVTTAGGGDLSATELLGRPELARELVRNAFQHATVATESGEVSFSSLGSVGGVPQHARALGAEQSNSSVVLDESLIAKLYRRLEAGVNPELELLRFLSTHEFQNVPELTAWWSYSGPLMDATLGIAQRYLPGAVDGWTLALEELPSDPQAFLRRVTRLGEVVGEMHVVLASDSEDPAFAPEDASPEMLALLRATVDDEIEQVFDHLPDHESVAPITGCGDAVRDLLGELSSFGSIGRIIRHHGDLHLGQALLAEDDWFVVDFEGEPGRPLPERRAKRSALRDVAGMLRSFAYVARVAGCDKGVEESARELFLDGYMGLAESAGILPPSHQVSRLLEIFELEKAVYELQYELSHRPAWVHIPVAGIESLLAEASL